MGYSIVRPLLFRLDPERAHAYTVQLLRLVGSFAPLGALIRAYFKAPSVPVQAFGLSFSNPIGLAAGYDKDGLAWRGLANLGFGHIEVGTVTPRPQKGNPKPRLFRLPEDRALINRMGFPGMGADYVVDRLRAPRPPGLVLGVNLGMNKDTPLEQAVQDYRALIQVFAPLADYLAINVSSPNTIGLRRLQARQALQDLLVELVQEKLVIQDELGRKVPLLLKLAPDLEDSELGDAIDVIMQMGLDGVIATNTTISRDGLHSHLSEQTGGLSGAPLKERSGRMVRQIYLLTDGKLPIIAVGGIMSDDDAKVMLDAGAVLVQIYTGLVYMGPGLVQKIIKGLAIQVLNQK